MLALSANNGKLLLQQKDKPALRSGEAILGIKKAGICGTDLAIASGDYRIANSVILGHEIFGIVDSISPSSELFPVGSRVTTEINVTCKVCELCKSGLRNHCSNIVTLGIDRDGGFADFVSAPIENLHQIPGSISDEEAVFVEPLAAAIELTKMAPIQGRSTIAIVGAGRLGLLILQVLKLQNPKLLVAVTRHKAKSIKRDLAISFGADEVFSSEDEVALIRRRTEGIGFDQVVEATGAPSGIDLALELVRPRGTIHIKSTHGLPANIDITKVVVKEIRIQGSRCGPFDDSIRLLDEGKVTTKELITSRFGLKEFEKAFAAARTPSEIKVIFDF
jgi:alcohol dehydrogenase